MLGVGLALGAVVAVEGATLGGIGGTVEGPSGPIPGATVTVTNPSLAVATGAQTDARGAWRVVPLPPGAGYVVRAAFPGMATVTVPDIAVVSGRVEALAIGLRPEGEVKEAVRVVGRTPVVDTAEATTQTRFSAEFIDALPILGREYQDVLTLAPGVTDVDGDGNPNIHGARDTDVVTLVDGVSTVDPLTGKYGQELNLGSIQEIEVKTSGASAEFGRAQGGFVNIVTKSGGNEFEGVVSLHLRSNLLDGDGAGADDPRLHAGLGGETTGDLEFTDINAYVSLSGPIRKDRAWYFVTAESIRAEQPVNATAQVFVRESSQWRVFGKASWDVSAGNKLVLSTTWDPQTYSDQGVGTFVPEESGWTLGRGGWQVLLRDTLVFNPNVFLETAVQYFETGPAVTPTLAPDTNGNGIFFHDRSQDGLWDASETDFGDDFDGDGAWDVFEDANHNGRLNAGEDRDADRRLTPADACEGVAREDHDCDGHLDAVDEDQNADGAFESDEDLDGDRRYDRGDEDRNFNGLLDDRPFPGAADVIYGYPDPGGEGTPFMLPDTYPYGALRPSPRDRQYLWDQESNFISGPYNLSADQDERRVTLRQDLTIFIPDWNGTHDLKGGLAFVDESFEQVTRLRPFMILEPSNPGFPRLFDAELPTEATVYNEAGSQTIGVYVQDSFKPRPNLTFNLGVRIDRETTDAFGYTPIDPAAQRALYDHLWALAGGERGTVESILGNNDGVTSQGYCDDPIFSGLDCIANPYDHPVLNDLARMRDAATARLTQHHAVVSVTAKSLESLYPEAVVSDPVTGETTFDRQILLERGAATFQEREAFRLTNNNLAPRIAATWDPLGDARTRLFANWGRYYDKLFLGAVVPEEGPDTIFRSYQLDTDGFSAAGVPNYGFGRVISKAPPSAAQVDRGLGTPYSDELSIGFEREIVPEMSLALTVIDRRYRDQLQDVDINHELRYDASGRPLDVIGAFAYDKYGTPRRRSDGRPDLFIHNYFFNQILLLGNFDSARYRGVELRLTRRLHRRWQMEASYVYSRAQGSAESYQSGLGDDPAVRETEYGYLDYDQRHIVKWNGVFYLAHDWQVGGAATWSSGLPYSNVDTFVSYDNYDFGQDRLLYGGPALDASGDPVFVPQRRNSERNAAFLNIDLRAQKSFVIGRTAARLFLTVDNLLNSDDLDVNLRYPGGQVEAERRFGRRFEIGMQVSF
jgi:hypothetical protein